MPEKQTTKAEENGEVIPKRRGCYGRLKNHRVICFLYTDNCFICYVTQLAERKVDCIKNENGGKRKREEDAEDKE